MSVKNQTPLFDPSGLPYTNKPLITLKGTLDRPGRKFRANIVVLDEKFEEDSNGSSLHPKTKIFVADAAFKYRLGNCKQPAEKKKIEVGDDLLPNFSPMHYLPLDEVPLHVLSQKATQDEDDNGEEENCENGNIELLNVEAMEVDDSTHPAVNEEPLFFCMMNGSANFCTNCTNCMHTATLVEPFTNAAGKVTSTTSSPRGKKHQYYVKSVSRA